MHCTHCYVALAFASVLLSAGSASAAVVDFTDSSVWGGATGAQSASTTIDGIGVTASAQPAAQGATLTQSDQGLGVNLGDGSSWTAQQIEGAEVLTIGFDEAVTIDEVYVTSLYEWGVFGIVWQDESGSFYYNDIYGNAQGGSFNADTWTGDQAVAVDSAATQSISFVAQGDWSNWQSNEFSIAGLSFTAANTATVPELDSNATHSALTLLLGASLVLAGRRRTTC